MYTSAQKHHKCATCGKEFALLGALKRHDRICGKHEGVMDFKCEVCDKVFGQMSDLKNHSNLVHEGNLQFVHIKPSSEPKIFKCETITPGRTNIRKCVISSCESYSNKGMFQFPKNLDLKRKWLDALNMDSHQPKDTVCKKHFNDNFYILPNGNYKLNREAVPSLCLPSSSHQSLSEQNKNYAVSSNKTFCGVYIKQESMDDNSVENNLSTMENRFESGENKRRKFMCKIEIKQEPPEENA